MDTITVDMDSVAMVLDSSEMTRDRAKVAIDEIVRRYDAWIAAHGYECEVVADYRASGPRRGESPEWRHEVADAVLIGQVDAIRAVVLG